MTQNDHILLFDGVCNLCNSFVKFTIRNDKKELIRFASLQSETGQEILKKHHLATSEFESFVYFRQGRILQRSTAALNLFKDLGGFWKILYPLIIVPKPVRDFFYNLVARSRYKIFGRTESCMVPTPELKKRFL